jgi:hypothetical protein
LVQPQRLDPGSLQLSIQEIYKKSSGLIDSAQLSAALRAIK